MIYYKMQIAMVTQQIIQEKDVAKALRKLNETCESGDFKMVDVLRRAGVRSIHSFHDYNRKHREFYECGI